MMSDMSAEQLVLIIAAVTAIVVPFFSAGAAWAAVKGSINGMRLQVKHTNEAVDEIKEDLKALVKSDGEQTTAIEVHGLGLHTLGKSVDDVRDRVVVLEGVQFERRAKPRE